MKILSEFLQNVQNLSQPVSWTDSLARIESENRYLASLVEKDEVSIYGVNTLTGHRDGERLTPGDISRYQEDLLESHAINVGSNTYGKHAARCISYAKLYTLAAGMSGVSPSLYQNIGLLAVDPEFVPRIPRHCSYSSGDVIPAAHWTREVLSQLSRRHGYIARPGDVMALINGNFIQLGFAAALGKSLKTAWLWFLELSAICCTVSDANRSNLFLTPSDRNLSTAAIEYVRSRAVTIDKSIQDPISLRGIPQVIDLLALAMNDFLQELDSLLLTPSGNPLYLTGHDRPLSQASFLAPALTLKASALIDAILFAMWSMTGRNTHILSGAIQGIPRDAANPSSSLGLIQYPKLMMSILERSRITKGRRVYASGASTSYGTEDLWNNGLTILEQLEDILQDFLLAQACELHILNYLDRHFCLNLAEQYEIIEQLRDAPPLEEIPSTIERFIENGGLKDSTQLFPV